MSLDYFELLYPKDFYSDEDEKFQDRHDGLLGKKVGFNPKSNSRKRIQDSEKQKPETKSDLKHKSNTTLFMYLVFSFILGHDSASLHLLLQDLESCLDLNVSLNDIEQYEASIQFGILEQRKFKNVLDKYIDSKFDAKHSLYRRKNELFCAYSDNTKRTVYTDDSERNPRDINLLLLACLNGDLTMIDIILDHVTDIDEEVFHAILCHRFVDPSVTELLMDRGHLLKFAEFAKCRSGSIERSFQWYKEDDKKFALRSLQALVYDCSITYDKRKWCVLKKIETVITWINRKKMGPTSYILRSPALSSNNYP